MSPIEGFSIQGVEIEGFKGFSSNQSLDFNGRHVFLLGPNGNGKSSVVEAIRWGLFGSAVRRNDIVKNQRYSGPCRVIVKLVRDGQVWTLQRTLNLGAGRSSDPVLTDHLGNRQLLREAIPQLESIDTGEGMHVVFAAQSAPLRRQPEDIGPFEKAVFDYLGLTHAQVLLSNLEEFLEDQASVEEELADELTELRDDLDRRIRGEEESRKAILRSPPWGNESSPSIAVSEQRAKRFLEEIADNHAADEFEATSLDALVDSAERFLDRAYSRRSDGLEDELERLVAYRETLEELHDTRHEIESRSPVLEETRSKLQAEYGGQTPDGLRDELTDARQRATAKELRTNIALYMQKLIALEDGEEISCPICATQCERLNLDATLQSATRASKSSIANEVAALESRVQESKILEELLKEQQDGLNSLLKAAADAADLLDQTDKDMLAEMNNLELIMERHSNRIRTIEAQIANEEQWVEEKENELARLQEEVSFHSIQRRLRKLEEDKSALDRIIEVHKHLTKFGISIRKIREAVSTQLRSQLVQDIPSVSDLFSEAFRALTQHSWYDRLAFAQAKFPELELRVGSSQDVSGREDPIGVLNGQAESALHLVPYFALSRADDTSSQVYLVMLDDPTRALDTEHIHILTERLHELGRNVQLIVASQETERLLEMVPKVFDKDSLTIIEAADWSPDSGPSLQVRYV